MWIEPTRIIEVHRRGRHAFVFRATLVTAGDWMLYEDFLDGMDAIGAHEVFVPAPLEFWQKLVEGQGSSGSTGGDE